MKKLFLAFILFLSLFLITSTVFASAYRKTIGETKMYSQAGSGEAECTTTIPANVKVQLIGKSTKYSNWYYVDYNGKQGFVNGEDLVQIPVTSGNCGNSVYWNIDDNGVLTISGKEYIDVENDEYPWSDFQITKINIENGIYGIPKKAFYDQDMITSIVIPDSVGWIASSAFEGCDKLKEVTIGDGVGYIGESAFGGCISLETVKFGKGLSYIYRDAFAGCSKLKTVTFPSRLGTIEKYAFLDCSSLEKIKFSNKIRSIGSNAFFGCKALKEVVIPESVDETGRGVFSGCDGLEKVINNGLSTIQVGSDTPKQCEKWVNSASGQVLPEISIGVPYSVGSVKVFVISSGVTAIKKVVHTVVKEDAVPATTTSIGKTEKEYCSVCGKVLKKSTTIPKLKLTKATIKSSTSKVKEGKKTIVKIISNSGAKLSVVGVTKDAKNKKYVKIKSEKTAKLTFYKDAPKGKYKFKVTSAAIGQYKKTTKTITIVVK